MSLRIVLRHTDDRGVCLSHSVCYVAGFKMLFAVIIPRGLWNTVLDGSPDPSQNEERRLTWNPPHISGMAEGRDLKYLAANEKYTKVGHRRSGSRDLILNFGTPWCLRNVSSLLGTDTHATTCLLPLCSKPKYAFQELVMKTREP